jgi:hypothetical protein
MLGNDASVLADHDAVGIGMNLDRMRRDNEAERGASIRMRMPEAWNAGRA